MTKLKTKNVTKQIQRIIEEKNEYMNQISNDIRSAENILYAFDYPYRLAIGNERVPGMLSWELHKNENKFRLLFSIDGNFKPLIESKFKYREFAHKYLPEFINRLSEQQSIRV